MLKMNFMPPLVIDEEIFRRRLLIDGEGMGDDKRFNTLLKSIYTWYNTKDQVDEEAHLSHLRLLQVVETCTLAMAKSTLMQRVNRVQVGKYEQLHKDLEVKIAQAQQDIAEKKDSLEKAKKVLSSVELCNSLIAVIKAQCNRKETMANLKIVNKEIETLEKQKLALTYKLNRRYKLFHTLCSSVYEAKQIINGEGDDGDDEDEEEDDTMNIDT